MVGVFPDAFNDNLFVADVVLTLGTLKDRHYRPVSSKIADALVQMMSQNQMDTWTQMAVASAVKGKPVALQKEALSQLRASDKPGIGRELLQRWPTLGPEARKLAGNILLYKARNHDLLLSALEKGKINAGELNLDLNHRVRTKDGNIYVSMIYQETDTEITLRMQGGIEKTIGKEDIEDLFSLGISLMPEGLEAGLSHRDMADLLAFLQHGLSGDGSTPARPRRAGGDLN